MPDLADLAQKVTVLPNNRMNGLDEAIYEIQTLLGYLKVEIDPNESLINELKRERRRLKLRKRYA